VVVFLRNPTSPPATIRLVKLEQTRTERDEYLQATFVLTNSSKGPICYIGRMGAAWPRVTELHQSGGEWKEDYTGGECGLSYIPTALLPNQSVVFEVYIDINRPTKIALEHSTRRKSDRLTAKLPAWVMTWFPLLLREKRLLSEEINPAQLTNIPYSSEMRSFESMRARLMSLRALALTGDSAAQFEMGELFWTEDIFEVEQALNSYEMAATNGHPRAAYNLGLIHDYVLADTTNAIKWYRLAKDLGCEEARRNLRELGAR